MTSRDFLKPKKFKIKVKPIQFESVEFMSDTDKQKIYKNFVGFLNNHFSRTTFKKNLYEHFHCHCGFIAHYNINGFYGEYFLKGAKLNKLAFNKELPMHENIGYINMSDTQSKGETFYAIYEELNGMREGIGEFYNTLINNRHNGAYSDYKDLDDAIKDAFNEYLEIFRDEIKKAIKSYNDFIKKDDIKKLKEQQKLKKEKSDELLKEANNIERTLLDSKATLEAIELNNDLEVGQSTLFDFLAA